MKKIIEEIEKRRAFRALSNEPVEQDVIERITKAAVLAPSCFNNQPWRFIIVNQDPALEAVKDAIPDGNYWAKEAPLFVLGVTAMELDCRLKDGREYAHYDLGLSMMNLMLQSVREGLIAHPIAGYGAKKLNEYFNLPEGFSVVNVVVVGKPGDVSKLREKEQESEAAPRKRKPLNEVVFYNSWQG